MNKTILFMGPPGAGKGTIAAKLISDYNVVHVATGDIFRNNIKAKTPVGLKALSFIEKGNLVPDVVTDEMVLNRLNQEDAKQRPILLDGYPRNLHQANKIVESLATINKKLDLVIWLDTPEEVLIERIVNRRLCKECGSVYNIKTLPPQQEGQCDKCQGELYQRVDDTYEKVSARLDAYKELTLPLLEKYQNQNLLVKIDSNKSVEAAYQDLIKVITK